MENVYTNQTGKKLLRITKHPFFSFIILGIVLVLMQILAIAGVLKSNVINGLATVMIYSIIGFGFTYLLGYAGLASLGTAGFVGLGSYLTAYFLREIPGVPYIVVLLIVLAVSILLGSLVGFISLRIEGIFLAIVTLGLSEVLYQVFNNWMDFTNGPNGSAIAEYPVFQSLYGSPLFAGIVNKPSFAARYTFFILIVVLMVVIMMLTYNLGKSSTGRAMLAMKNSTSAAQAMGISLLKYRLLAFILATVYAGFAGVLYMSYFKFVNPSTFTLMFSLNVLCAVIIGGTRSLWGTIFGCFVVFGMNTIILQKIPFFNTNSWLIYVLIGAIIIVIIMFYRGGVVQLVGDFKQMIRNMGAKRRLYKYGEE